MEQKRAWRIFWLTNAGLLVGVGVLYPTLLFLAQRFGGLFRFCFLHDVCHLYCVTCGGTRATWLLLHGQVLEALQSNAAVVWSYAALVAVDVRALVHLLRGGVHPFRLPRAFWWVLGGSVLGYAVLRDVCLVAFHWDWIGDFIR